jgi:hypothetical protein
VLSDFVSNGGGALSDVAPISETEKAAGALGHYLRQNGPSGIETAAIWTSRPQTERGNAYLGGTQIAGPLHAKYNIFPSVDCANVPGGAFQRPENPPTDDPGGKGPSCWTQPLPGAAGPNSIPHIAARDYLTAAPRTR